VAGLEIAGSDQDPQPPWPTPCRNFALPVFIVMAWISGSNTLGEKQG
jgi:hypothetical protein